MQKYGALFKNFHTCTFVVFSNWKSVQGDAQQCRFCYCHTRISAAQEWQTRVVPRVTCDVVTSRLLTVLGSTVEILKNQAGKYSDWKKTVTPTNGVLLIQVFRWTEASDLDVLCVSAFFSGLFPLLASRVRSLPLLYYPNAVRSHKPNCEELQYDHKRSLYAHTNNIKSSIGSESSVPHSKSL